MRLRHLAPALLLVAQTSFAQSGGSAYSLFGVGDLRYYPSARSIGMGSTGIGLQSPSTINASMPAAWARIAQTRLEAGLFYEGFNSTDGNTTRYLGDVAFAGGMLAIPISKDRGITLVGGFVPAASSDYDITTRQPYSSASDTTSFLVRQVEDGRISQAQVGLSWAPLRNVTLGASFVYRFGKYTKTLEQEATSTSYAGGTITQETSLRSSALTVGAQMESLGMIGDALAPFSFGAVFTTGGPLLYSVDRIYNYTAEADTLPTFESSFKVPVSIGGGIGYQMSPRWLAALDVVYQPRSSVIIEGRPVSTLKDATRIGLGFEHVGSREINASWLDKCAYRFGASFVSTYLDINGTSIDEWFITAGATVPLSGENRIATAIEAGQRGTTANGLIKDTIIRFHVALLISELWFTRPEDE
ncbi:MAG: hypothetical protein H6Q28_179 [Bacteroidetes bacterium]|nr:hypothetical protein [Bacteroidota bacterium]